jgi:ABC-type sugar transport system substrate-binding protein
MYSMMLMRKAKGWFTGYNSNVDGHEAGKVRYFVYNGGTPKYVSRINDCAAKGYEGVVMSSSPPPSSAEVSAAYADGGVTGVRPGA